MPEPTLSSPPAGDGAAAFLLIVETAGSVFWLGMDAGWMLGWRLLAAALLLPALFAHLLLFRYTPRTIVAMAVVGSMNCWFGMNAAWMLGDVWTMPGFLLTARVLCVAATVLLAVAFSQSRWRPEARLLLFAGFRRIRLAFQERPKS